MKIERDSILHRLRQIIMEERDLEDASFLQGDTDLFEAGLMDSLMALTVVSFCEEHFGCQMEPSELSEENFRSLNVLADFVCRKLETEVAE